MVKLRLTRTGRKNAPAYRIVAIHAKEKRDSRAIEYLGHYLPVQKEVRIEKERAQYWLSIGAQPSATVTRLLIKEGVLAKPAKAQPAFKKQAGKKSQSRSAKKAVKAEAKATPAAEPTTEDTASA